MLRPLSPANRNKKMVAFCEPPSTTPSSHIQSLPVPSTSEQIIQCFCSTIRSIKTKCICAGILVSSNIKHRVWVPRAPLASARVVSLAELLSLPAPHMRERLKLAVRLASSVLQFHTSGWLQERWSKQDIYLVQRDSAQLGSRNPSLETPVVHQAFTSEPTLPEVPTESSIICCNLSLFSLGIVLIELWFWKSVESFQAEKPQVEDPDTAIYITAMGLIKTLHEHTGMNYKNIVKRCICGIDHPETRLEDNAFKKEVDLKVLQPLEKHLEDFCGEPLRKIFAKPGVH